MLKKNIFPYEKLNPQGRSGDSGDRISLSALRFYHETYSFSRRTDKKKFSDFQQTEGYQISSDLLQTV